MLVLIRNVVLNMRLVDTSIELEYGTSVKKCGRWHVE